MIVTGLGGSPPVAMEQALVATLVEAATKGDLAVVSTIRDQVSASNFADPASEHVFTLVGQRVEAQLPITRAAIEEADVPPGIIGTVDCAAVLDTPPLADNGQLVAAIEAVVRAAALRKARVALEDAAAGVHDASANPSVALETIARSIVAAGEELEAAQVRARGHSSAASLVDEIDQVISNLQETHGKKFLGLPTHTLPTLDKLTLGLRGFILLAAEPGVGKTALGTQIGFDIVDQNADAVFIFFTFEMSRRDIYHRLLSMVSELHWRTVVLGSPGAAKSIGHNGLALNTDHMAAFQKGVAALRAVGKRIFIFDLDSTPKADFDTLLARISNAKKQAGVNKAIIVVDSLQAIPFVKSEGAQWSNDVERDNHVINRLLALQRITGDALLLISEQNKDGMGKANLKSTRGTARAVYSPDCVFILQRSDKVATDPEATETLVTLRIIKGRDGVLRSSMPLVFEHVTCTFTERDDAIVSNQQGALVSD